MNKPKRVIVLSCVLMLAGLNTLWDGFNYLAIGLLGTWPIAGYTGLARGVAAIVASVTCWQQSRWAGTAFVVWSVISVVRSLFLSLFIRQMPLWLALALVLGMIVFYYIVYVYVYKKTDSYVSDAAVQ